MAIIFQNNTWFFVPTTGIKFYPHYPGIQAQIDISKYVEGSIFRRIQFLFKKSKNNSIEIELDDGSWDTLRPLYERKMRQKGTAIKLEKTETKAYKQYFTTIRQIVHEEDDKSINCKNYPNEKFDSYEDCDMEFLRQTYQSLYHQKNCCRVKNISAESIVPIFTTNNLDEVTKLAHADCDEGFMMDLVMKQKDISSCPRPCTTTFTDTMLTSYIHTSKDATIGITFDKSTLVTRIKVDNFQMAESLNFLGSNLGLWPGLGIFQLIQWLLKNISWRMLIEKCIKRGPQQTVN